MDYFRRCQWIAGKDTRETTSTKFVQLQCSNQCLRARVSVESDRWIAASDAQVMAGLGLRSRPCVSQYSVAISFVAIISPCERGLLQKIPGRVLQLAASRCSAALGVQWLRSLLLCCGQLQCDGQHFDNGLKESSVPSGAGGS